MNLNEDSSSATFVSFVDWQLKRIIGKRNVKNLK
jgi:hypothetical protein